MDNKMDNFSKQRKQQKSEKDQISFEKKSLKKKKIDNVESLTLNEFDMIKNTYGSYYCSDCDFDTKNLKDYKRHLTTKKHLFGVPILTPKFVTKKVSLFVCGCGNSYKYASGLSKHRIKCKNKKINKIPKKTVTVNTFHNKHNEMNHGNKKFVSGEIEIVEIMKQTLNQTETINKLLEQNSVLIEKLSEKPTNNITYQNCGNKKMTINVFLNEKCKDAMNLTDFVNNMNISLEDLMYTKNYGYNKGISNIFVKHLKDLQPSERPIHCSDKKRMQFYVRDENKWLKDEKNEKIDKSIHDLSIKQIKHLKEWEMQNPHYLQDEKLLSQWQQLIHEIMGPSDDSTREKDKESIMKTLGNTVELKDSLIIPMKD